jgi:hypothetical protein
MRLGNLLSKETKTALYAVTVVPWHKRPDKERMQAVHAACQSQAVKIGQFIDKKGRRLCTEEIPHGRKLMTEWVIAHATALAETNRHMKEQACLNHSLHDILSEYGYSANPNQLFHEFGRFHVR